MPNYRRLFVPGGSWFFTVNLRNRSQRLLVQHFEDFERALWETQRRRHFQIDAWLVLPDHLHAIWTLPQGDSDYPSRWRDIKVAFSKAVPKGDDPRVWQRGYWEHLIRDERDLKHHVAYCWFNPIKHGLVARVEDWPYSSFHRDMADRPQPGDLERALETYAQRTGSYGERT